MSRVQFEKEVAVANLTPNDRKWFPLWLRRYSADLPALANGNFPVTRKSVTAFSRSLLANGAAGWQRLQAVHALICYRDLVLKRSEPDLQDIVQTLQQIASRERRTGAQSVPSKEEIDELRGRIDPNEPPLIQAMRGEIRLLHYSYQTEKAYVRWVKRFITFVGTPELDNRER